MPEISDAELAELRSSKESAAKLAEKNKELLAEKQAIAAREAESAAKIKAAEEARAAAEAEKLKAAGDYKTLAESLEADRKARETADKERSEKLAKGAKLSGIQSELSKLGINADRIPHALRLADLEGVKYDEATNIVTGADAAALKLKAALPELFVKADKEKTEHDQGGGKPPAEMTIAWFNSLPEAEKKKHYKEFMKSQGVSIR